MSKKGEKRWGGGGRKTPLKRAPWSQKGGIFYRETNFKGGKHLDFENQERETLGAGVTQKKGELDRERSKTSKASNRGETH